MSSSFAFSSSSRKASHHRQMSPMDWNQRGIQMMTSSSNSNNSHWKAALDCFRRALLVVGSNNGVGSLCSSSHEQHHQILMNVIAAEAKAAETYPFHSTPFPLMWVSASTDTRKAAVASDEQEESAAAFCLQSAILITNTAIVYHRQASQQCYAQKAVALYTKAWQLLHRMPTNSTTAPTLVQYLILTIGSNVLHLVIPASSSSERWSWNPETTLPLIQEFAWYCQQRHVQQQRHVAPPRIAQAIEAKRAVGCLAFFWLHCRQAPHAGAA